MININSETIDYCKGQAAQIGIPYQTLINLYLTDCIRNNRKLKCPGLDCKKNYGTIIVGEEPLRCVSFLLMSTKNIRNVHKPEGEKCRIYADSRVLTRGSSLPSATPISPGNADKYSVSGVFLLLK